MRHIGRNPDGPPAQCLNFFARNLEPVRVARQQTNASPAPGELTHSGPPYPSSRTGDDDNFHCLIVHRTSEHEPLLLRRLVPRRMDVAPERLVASDRRTRMGDGMLPQKIRGGGSV